MFEKTKEWFKKKICLERNESITAGVPPDGTDGKSHPCAGCLSQPKWRGQLCHSCQEKFDLWCPCATIAEYERGATRQPIPGYIVPQICNRCGYRIKAIYETDDDDEIERLTDQMWKANGRSL